MCARRNLTFRRKPEFAFIPSARLQDMVNSLLMPENHRLMRQLDGIFQANGVLTGNQEAFSYLGKNYRRFPASIVTTHLHSSLHEEMDHYLMLSDKLSADAAIIVQGMSSAVTRCATLEDLRDVLPDILVGLDDELKSRPRMRPPGFSIEDAPAKLAQFEKAEETAAYYLANRILYS